MGEPTELTPRQTVVLFELSNGETPKAIARTLYLHPGTVGNILQDIRARLHAETTAHAVAIAVRRGLIP